MKNETKKVILVDAYHCLFTENGINTEMQEILDSFSNRKIVLTNADDEQMVKFGIDKSPYEVFTLKHKPNKTDGGYYEKMLKHFNLKAENCLYIEHNLEAIKSAVSKGIKSYNYNKKKERIEMKDFLENNIDHKSAIKNKLFMIKSFWKTVSKTDREDIATRFLLEAFIIELIIKSFYEIDKKKKYSEYTHNIFSIYNEMSSSVREYLFDEYNKAINRKKELSDLIKKQFGDETVNHSLEDVLKNNSKTVTDFKYSGFYSAQTNLFLDNVFINNIVKYVESKLNENQ